MYVNHPLIKPNTVESRTYQELIVAKALEKNTLCVLGTGLGKTVIATLTIAGVLYKRDGKVLIIAPSRPLVEQHYNSLKSFLNISEKKIVVLTGKISPEKREKLWKTGKIFIATPQVVENDIVAGRVPIDEFVLLIVDEAHHTTGNHSYTFVASAFKGKVRVLGLTASPGSDIDKILEVCENLGIEHVEIKTPEDPDVKKYVKTVKIKTVKVKLPKEYLECIELIREALKERLKILRDCKIIPSTEVNRSELLSLQKRVMEIEDNSKYELIRVVSEAIKLDYAVEILECQGRDVFLNYFERLGSQNTRSAKEIVRDSRVMKAVYKLRTLDIDHPKLDKLLEIIKNILSKNEKEKIIVFVQYRDTVEKIMNLLKENNIGALPFMGQSNRGGRGMSQKEQIRTLERFKRDESINVLVSTSVSEEGIDITSVNYVIFYEPVPSEIRFIQRKGRASRGEGGECIILITENTRDEVYYWSAIQKERNMKRILREMVKTLNKKLKEKKIEEYKGPLDIYIEASSKLEEDKKEDIKKKPKIVIDHREKNIGKLLFERAELEFKNLDFGDYILSDRVIVERKTSEDFENSIIDKRLFKQLKELKNYEKPILIIEGDRFERLEESAIKGAILSIVLDYHIPIIFTKNIEETADVLLKLAEREQLKNKRPVEIRTGKKPMSLRERQRFIVESFPDVGPVTAENLLLNFGTIQNIVNASEEELMKVEGVGKTTAKKIREVLTEKYTKS
ncbi:DEAD/DEAH box helicase [Methanofervidicoccus abyssi]|uniref:Fanconi anemia group M protein n=1 Tax=Methanofervidicoccus abyssi TaxID=2082189 RepID=A0A401HPN4_9EURY|nr:DEAD/DEAH box helicase [Methanofervidicoccus abyssi]GBF36237.1 fanconi anemia group M protein [Methanofervidicoccus abyssi]